MANLVIGVDMDNEAICRWSLELAISNNRWSPMYLQRVSGCGREFTGSTEYLVYCPFCGNRIEGIEDE